MEQTLWKLPCDSLPKSADAAFSDALNQFCARIKQRIALPRVFFVINRAHQVAVLLMLVGVLPMRWLFLRVGHWPQFE